MPPDVEWDGKQLKARLYQTVSQVFINDDEKDRLETTFGLRSFQFTTTNGFLLNGKQVRIKGVCLHQDYGALGTALNLRALERQ